MPTRKPLTPATLIVVSLCTFLTLHGITAVGQTPVGSPAPAARPDGAVRRIGGYGAQAQQSAGVYLLAFSPDGKQLASRHADQVVRTWETSNGKLQFKCEGHNGTVKALAYSADGKQIFTAAAGPDEVVQVWKAADGGKLHQLKGGAEIIQVLPSGDQIAVADTGRFAHLLIENAEQLAKYAGAKYPLAISPDGRAHAGTNNTDAASITVFRPFDSSFGSLTGLSAAPGGALYSHDGKRFAAFPRREKHPVLVWDADSKGAARFKLSGHASAVQSLAFSYDHRFLATGGWDGDVCVWEMLTGRLAARLKGHHATVCSLAFSPAGGMLASGASGPNDNSILLWNMRQAVFKPAHSSAEIAALGSDKIWSQLGGDDAAAAMQLCGSLAAAAGHSLPLLQKRLDTSVKSADAAAIDRMIAELDHDSSRRRDAASVFLAKLRPDIDQRLKAEMAKRPSFEQHQRLKDLLAAPAGQARLDDEDIRPIFRAVLA